MRDSLEAIRVRREEKRWVCCASGQLCNEGLTSLGVRLKERERGEVSGGRDRSRERGEVSSSRGGGYDREGSRGRNDDRRRGGGRDDYRDRDAGSRRDNGGR